jgi:hypothetical protein
LLASTICGAVICFGDITVHLTRPPPDSPNQKIPEIVGLLYQYLTGLPLSVTKVAESRTLAPSQLTVRGTFDYGAALSFLIPLITHYPSAGYLLALFVVPLRGPRRRPYRKDLQIPLWLIGPGHLLLVDDSSPSAYKPPIDLTPFLLVWNQVTSGD